jgi:hypothetical protein
LASPARAFSAQAFLKFDTSGKSPAYIHRRNNKARAGKPVAGFFNRAAKHFPEAVIGQRGATVRFASFLR